MVNSGTSDRREFLRLLRLGGLSGATAATALWLNGRSVAPVEPLTVPKPRIAIPPAPGLPEMVVIQGDDPRLLVRKAVDQLGGMGRFISRGDVVVIKANASWDRTPEQAANTNPLVVSETTRSVSRRGRGR